MARLKIAAMLLPLIAIALPAQATDINGTRNGDLQIAQFVDGGAQPSELAGELAGALFYGSAQWTGIVHSSGNVLQTGNLTWAGPPVSSVTDPRSGSSGTAPSSSSTP